jgi:ankyrin repeat protein
MKWYRGTMAALVAVSLGSMGSCKKAAESVKSDLREAGYQLTAVDWFRAARANDVAALKKFEAGKFPLDTRDAAGDTALHAAAQAGATEAADHLLKRGVAIDVTGAGGRTPLMAATLAGQTEMVRWLLRQGASPTLKDEQGFKPLMLAVREGKTGAVAELAPYDRSDLDAALLLAALVGRADVIDTLTNFGASVYGRMEDGRTPLMVAAENGHEEAVKLLLDIGSSRFTTDAEGRTAADLATTAGHPEIAALLTREPVAKDFSLDSPAEIAAALDQSAGTPAAKDKASTEHHASLPIEGAKLSPRVPIEVVSRSNPSAATAGDETFSMPPLVMRSYREKEMPISVRSVRGDSAIVHLGGPTGADVTVKAGDELPGTHLVVLRVQRRMENSKVSHGEPVEISVVAVRDTSTDRTREWISGIPATAHDPVALVEDAATGRRYVVSPGQRFHDAEGNEYLISEVRPNQVVIQDVTTGGVRTIRLRGPRG